MRRGFHHLMRFCGVGQRQHGMRDRFQLACGEERPDLFGQCRRHLGFERVGAGAQGRAGIAQPFQHHRRQVDLNLAAAVKRQLDDAGVGAGGLDVAGNVVTADDIEDDVGAARRANALRHLSSRKAATATFKH